MDWHQSLGYAATTDQLSTCMPCCSLFHTPAKHLSRSRAQVPAKKNPSRTSRCCAIGQSARPVQATWLVACPTDGVRDGEIPVEKTSKHRPQTLRFRDTHATENKVIWLVNKINIYGCELEAIYSYYLIGNGLMGPWTRSVRGTSSDSSVTGGFVYVPSWVTFGHK